MFGLNNDSEEEDNNTSSNEEEEDTRFSKTNLQKHSFSDEDSDEDDNDSAEEDEDTKDNDKEADVKDSDNEENMENDVGYDEPEDLSAFGESKKSRKNKKLKSLTPEELEKFEKARKRTGVCYLSRIPPFMKPSRVRALLEKYAEIGRIYLVPEGKKEKGEVNNEY